MHDIAVYNVNAKYFIAGEEQVDLLIKERMAIHFMMKSQKAFHKTIRFATSTKNISSSFPGFKLQSYHLLKVAKQSPWCAADIV